MIWHLTDDIVEIVPGIDVMVPACGQQGAYDGHVLRCLVVAAEEVVLASLCPVANYVGIMSRLLIIICSFLH